MFKIIIVILIVFQSTSLLILALNNNNVVEIHRSPELEKISLAHLKFAHRLYKVLFQQGSSSLGDNFVYSPLILHLSLSSLKLAASDDGDTLRELNAVTSLTRLNTTFVQNGYEDLIDLLKSSEDSSTVIKLVNRIFTTSLFKLDGNYARLLRNKFGGYILPIDFSNSSQALDFINSHVANYTNGTIRRFLDQIDQNTKVVILNSLLFQGGWEREFTPLLTEKRPFMTEEEGVEVEVEMMNRGGFYPYAEIVELNSTTLSIPYKGNRYSLTFILPERGIPLAQLERNLETYPMQAVLAKMSSRYIQLSVPKFTIESSIDMVGPLQLLGVKSLLSPNADLTKMSRKQGLYVNSVVQRASLTVSEGGSQVASSNFVEAVPVTPRFLVPFSLDRPFMFFLTDHITNTILMVGKKSS